jgi:ADP-glucose pyrophosphorylase
VAIHEQGVLNHIQSGTSFFTNIKETHMRREDQEQRPDDQSRKSQTKHSISRQRLVEIIGMKNFEIIFR